VHGTAGEPDPEVKELRHNIENWPTTDPQTQCDTTVVIRGSSAQRFKKHL